MKMNLQKGLTLVELMITFAIVAIVLSIAVMTLSGYIPKQHLISNQNQLADLIQRAQTEANAKSFWSCIKFSTSGFPITAQLFLDTDTTGVNKHGKGANGTSCGTGDTPITSVTFKDTINIPTGGACAQNISRTCVIWFDTTGSPKVCGTSASGCGTAADAATPALDCVDWSYQIVISNSRLAPLAKAREVEVLQGGLVQIVKPADSGLVTANPLSAKSENNSSGCE